MKNNDIYIFDLDETLVSSHHRTPNNSDGSINLAAYFQNATRENIFKDTLLPASKILQWARDKFLTIICSARDMNQDDMDYLKDNGLETDYVIGRHTARETVPDDSKPSIWQMMQEKTLPVKPHYFQRDPILKERNLQFLSNLKQFKDSRKIFFEDSQPTIQHFKSKSDYLVIDANNLNRWMKL